MSGSAQDKAWRVWELGQTDPVYAKMLQEMKELDRKYEAVLRELPYDHRDIICDFVSMCEDMSWRMLEIACAMAGNLK